MVPDAVLAFLVILFLPLRQLRMTGIGLGITKLAQPCIKDLLLLNRSLLA